ncbi:MAG: hypothetical protein JRI72_11025 [Deltaproteobacteria bacterium]|nr:hypothetical protein [Deltaproteobacteria bacterium]
MPNTYPIHSFHPNTPPLAAGSSTVLQYSLVLLPGKQNQAGGRTHISIKTMIFQLRTIGAQSIITYDQSDSRNSGLTRDEQRKAKMRRLADEGFHSFYYVSHAPFLFAVPNTEALSQIQRILKKAGIPEERFEKHW